MYQYFIPFYCLSVVRNSVLWLFHLHTFIQMIVLVFFILLMYSLMFNSPLVVQSLSHVWLFATPWTAARQTSLSSAISQSLLKFMSIESVMLYNHFILCYPLLLLPSIFPNIRVFSNKLALCMRWPKYWSFSFIISPSNEYQGWFPLGLTGWISLLSKGLSRVFSSITIQKHQFLGAQPSL